ncbi:hypothetical protein [Cryptosporangium phraense]|uniref:Uncharacterized protein n=1 Tax=Cryptosporangium phraense TaxID=2593070 RepID=A0A545ANL2_9ACTN|nr:hypothetical protein [Cryptosporangium phraense]TQS42851.1 hypothetical protein FL583_22640 [Cryptosporangium phraense]
MRLALAFRIDRAMPRRFTMPKSLLKTLARQCRRYTGERYQKALTRLAADPGAPPIPIASPAQAQLEAEVLAGLGQGWVTDSHGAPPTETPFALTSVTPLPDALEVTVQDIALPDVITALLPTTDEQSNTSGIAGLRFRLQPSGVELTRLDLPGVVRITGVTPAQWWQAYAVAEADTDVPILSGHHPDRMHPAEEAHARAYCPGYSPRHDEPRDQALAALTSAFLRRHMIFRTPEVTSIDLWSNPDSLEVEWFGPLTHTQAVTDLCDPVFGLGGTPSKDCECERHSWCFVIPVITDPVFGTCVALRHNRHHDTDDELADNLRDDWRRKHRSERLSQMERWHGARPRTQR